MAKQVRVLVADDSSTALQLLSFVVNQAPDMQIVGEARDGEEAVNLTAALKPDVVLMDITMPKMDGLEATRIIMQRSPTPIIIVSTSITGRETEVVFQALRSGALTVLPKPAVPRTPVEQAQIATLLNTIRAMAEVQVIHHRWKSPASSTMPDASVAKKVATLPANMTAPPEIVAIASSTGGPAALNTILAGLPGNFSLPIVIVQHIAPDFLPSLVGWLDAVAPLRVKAAEHGEQPEPGTVYFAPGDTHLVLSRSKRFDLTYSRDTRHVPSGDVLLESVAQSYRAHAIGMVLTGMGADGAYGLRQMHDAGAITIAQDEESSVVYGMPHEAFQMNAVQYVLGLLEIPDALIRLVKK